MRVFRHQSKFRERKFYREGAKFFKEEGLTTKMRSHESFGSGRSVRWDFGADVV